MAIRNILANLLSPQQASASVPQSQEERDAARLAEAKAWIAAREKPKHERAMAADKVSFSAEKPYWTDPKYSHLPGNVFNTDNR